MLRTKESSAVPFMWILPDKTHFVNKINYIVTHAEADITLCNYMLKVIDDGVQITRILSDDMDVFILLLY